MAISATVYDEGVDALFPRVSPVMDLPEFPAATLGTGLELLERDVFPTLNRHLTSKEKYHCPVAFTIMLKLNGPVGAFEGIVRVSMTFTIWFGVSTVPL